MSKHKTLHKHQKLLQNIKADIKTNSFLKMYQLNDLGEYQSKIILDRINQVEKHFSDINAVFAGYARKQSKLLIFIYGTFLHNCNLLF